MLQRCAKSITSASIKSSRLSAATFTNTGKRCPYAFNKYSRCFSASPIVGTASDKAAAIAEAASSITPGAADSLPSTIVDSVTQVDEAAAVIGFSPSQVIMQIIDQVHLLVGIPYWEAIILTTIGLRVVMLPMAISSVQNAAKMGALRPAIQAIKDRQAKHPSGDDPSIRSRFEAETKQLFLSHKVNPLKSIAMPLIQLPIFLSLYFALRDMGIYFPEYSTGGEFWFSDLTAADQYYIFPAVNALSFLVMIEIGADGIQTENQGMFKWGMRALAVIIGPLTMSTPQGVFLYWTANNVVSVAQSLVLKQEAVKKYLQIPNQPKPEDTPIFKMVNPFRSVIDVVKKETTPNRGNIAEIVDRPEPAPLKVAGPPPVTFSAPPKKSKKMKR